MRVEITEVDDNGNVIKNVINDSLNNIVWDSFLIAETQDEHWHDEDTANLIVCKLRGEKK